MTADLERLVKVLQEDMPERTLEAQIASHREEIEQSLEMNGEYILTDQKGNSFRITSTNLSTNIP